MAIISNEEFFDFDDYYKRIAGLLRALESVTTGREQSTVSSVDRIKTSLDSLQKQIAPFWECLKGLSITIFGND